MPILVIKEYFKISKGLFDDLDIWAIKITFDSADKLHPAKYCKPTWQAGKSK